MKTVLKIGLVLVAMIALSSCSKKGGGNAAAGVPGAGIAGCTPDANGGCAGQQPFFGTGRFSGVLQVQNMALYQQFMIENGLCYNFGFNSNCHLVTNWLGLSVSIRQGQARMTLSTYVNRGYNGQWGQSLRQNANIYQQPNGILLSTRLGFQTMQYPQPQVPVNNNLLQVVIQTGVSGQYSVTVQPLTTVYYRGQVIATGSVNGNIQPGYGGYYNGQQQPYGTQQRPSVLPYSN